METNYLSVKFRWCKWRETGWAHAKVVRICGRSLKCLHHSESHIHIPQPKRPTTGHLVSLGKVLRINDRIKWMNLFNENTMTICLFGPVFHRWFSVFRVFKKWSLCLSDLSHILVLFWEVYSWMARWSWILEMWTNPWNTLISCQQTEGMCLFREGGNGRISDDKILPFHYFSVMAVDHWKTFFFYKTSRYKLFYHVEETRSAAVGTATEI